LMRRSKEVDANVVWRHYTKNTPMLSEKCPVGYLQSHFTS